MVAVKYIVSIGGDFTCHHCQRDVGAGERALTVECEERGALFDVCSASCNRADLECWRYDNDNRLPNVRDWECFEPWCI